MKGSLYGLDLGFSLLFCTEGKVAQEDFFPFKFPSLKSQGVDYLSTGTYWSFSCKALWNGSLVFTSLFTRP